MYIKNSVATFGSKQVNAGISVSSTMEERKVGREKQYILRKETFFTSLDVHINYTVYYILRVEAPG